MSSYISDGEKLLEKKEIEMLSNLTLQGIVGIEDPVREQVQCCSYHKMFLDLKINRS